MRFPSALLALTLALTAAVSAQNKTMIPPPPDVAAPPADASKTSSGLATRVLKPGTGTTRPSRADFVTVQYTGWTTDGKMFDSSVARGQAATFPLDRVIPGWSEAVQLMVAGESRRVWIPESLAYGGKRDPKGMLVFDVELVGFRVSPTPDELKGPPADARKTPSGLAYKVLEPGTGARRPSGTSQVSVQYTGRTTDGRVFDSSVLRGEPATFALNDVIPGWTEGLQLMVEGETTRFWIPESLAYKGKSAPYGMLIFDVELLKIN